ncbi:hypothetical protein C6369_002530 [Rhodococcus rhodochrous]|uniref:hypothetical protein n=1 Tax=Rhodococcus rhodochrous TaxID=1829 RepID=UPI000D07A73E|nr:hypothetical protein [Rhodococcus rhodochrous]AYA23513.1 hypothetical protein C6369_002530 [Rhodococcus rhodochrous]
MLWTVLRVIGTVFGVFFFIMAISVLRAAEVWLPAVILFAAAWALLYFSAVAPWVKRRTSTTAPPQPGRRTRSALRKAAIGVVAPFLVVIVTGIVDVAVHPGEYEAAGADTTTSSKQATPSASPTAGPTAAPETMTEQPGPIAFTESMVRAHGVTKDDQGGQSNVRFVAGTEDPERIEDLRRQCVQHYLETTKSAYCYGYANDADYGLTTVEWTPDFDESIYGQGRPCWITYGGQPIAGPPGTETTKSALEYRTQGCPGGVLFPDYTPPVPAPTTETSPVTVPVHNACALLDADALTAGGFSDRTEQAPGAPESTARGDVLATYACGNADASVIVEIDLHNTPESAREAADYNTSNDQRFLIDSGTRVPFDPLRGGAKIINTELGISRVSWSNGPYAVLLEVMSDPVIPGLPTTHPHENIDTMITAIVERADARLASSSW